MKKVMPQEIEVWYLIPALRKNLVKIFVDDYKKSQKEAAKILGITEATASNYLKSKRGSDIKFSKKEQEEIKKAAKAILEDPSSVMRNLYGLCVLFRESKVICNIHMREDKSLPKNCRDCFEG